MLFVQIILNEIIEAWMIHRATRQFDSIGFDLSNPPELIVKILKATD